MVTHGSGYKNTQGLHRMYFRNDNNLKDDYIFYDSDNPIRSWRSDWTKDIKDVRLLELSVEYAIAPTFNDRYIKLNLGKNFIDADNFHSNLDLNKNDIVLFLDSPLDTTIFFKRVFLEDNTVNLTSTPGTLYYIQKFEPTVQFLYTPSVGNSILRFKFLFNVKHF